MNELCEVCFHQKVCGVREILDKFKFTLMEIREYNPDFCSDFVNQDFVVVPKE